MRPGRDRHRVRGQHRAGNLRHVGYLARFSRDSASLDDPFFVQLDQDSERLGSGHTRDLEDLLVG